MKNQKKFIETLEEIYPNLVARYAIKREMDILNECIQFADNTRDSDFQSLILEEILTAKLQIINYIKNYETINKENTMESSN